MGLEQVRAGGAPFTEELLRTIAKRMSEAKVLHVCVCVFSICWWLSAVCVCVTCVCDVCLLVSRSRCICTMFVCTYCIRMCTYVRMVYNTS